MAGVDPGRAPTVLGEVAAIEAATECRTRECSAIPPRTLCFAARSKAKLAGLRASVKIRSRHEPAAACLTPMAEGFVRVEFDAPQQAITPGQAAVFFDNDVVLGGGWIARDDGQR